MNRILSKYCMLAPILFVRQEPVARYLELYRQSQWWPDKALHEYQSRRLVRLIEHAKTNVPFYRELYKEIKLHSVRTVRDIAVLPFITKSDVGDHGPALISDKRFLFSSKKTTGGSTGTPVTIVKTNKSVARERAATWRAYEWAGVRIGDPHARFWGTPLTQSMRFKSRLVDHLTNRIRLSAFSFSEDRLLSYYNNIIRFRPSYLYGYVSMIYLFANCVKKHGLVLPEEVQCVITTSEMLSEPIRKEIEGALGRRVFNEYGCGEVGSIAHECPSGCLHIMAENLIVEVLKDGQPAKPGEIGEIVVTELNNYAMPLIRYRLEDFVQLGSGDVCKCGRTLPLIDQIIGRSYDMLKTDDGRLFHGEFFMYIFEDLKKKKPLAVKQFQIIQVAERSLCVRLVTGDGYSPADKEWISRRISSGMGEGFGIEFELVRSIPREASGKVCLIKAMKML